MLGFSARTFRLYFAECRVTANSYCIFSVNHQSAPRKVGTQNKCSSYSLRHTPLSVAARARSNDLAGRSTALAQALAPPCLALRIALLR